MDTCEAGNGVEEIGYSEHFSNSVNSVRICCKNGVFW